jgi:hypothetical protein
MNDLTEYSSTNSDTAETATSTETLGSDVFAAAQWFDDLWNSSARAVAADEIEWHCATWGSGRGHGDWLDTAMFHIVVNVFGLRTWRNRSGRDELVVAVPLNQVASIAAVVEKLDGDPDDWPWFDEDLEDDLDRRIAVAAACLAVTPEAIHANEDLLGALRVQ